MDTKEARDTGARVLLVSACMIVVIAGLKAAQELIAPFLVALFLSMISLPLLNWLQSKRIPRPLAVTITIVAALLVLGGVVVLVGGSIREFVAQAPRYQARLESIFRGLLEFLQSRGINISEQITSELLESGKAMEIISGTLKGAAAVLSNVLLVLLTIVFILSEAAGFPEKLRAAFGPTRSSERIDVIRNEVQRFLGIKTLISLTTGSVVAGSMAVIGVDFPLLWGAVAFLLNYIPQLGSIIAAIPPFLLAIVQLGWGHALAVAIVFLAVNLTLGSFLEPYFMGRRLGLSTLVVFLSLVFWTWVLGAVGALLSVPLTMILKIMLENTEDLRWIAVLLDSGPGRSRAARAAAPPSPSA